MPLLAVEQLAVTLATPRGTVRALREVSFSLDRGQTLGLIGESGCGKSITALALMGLLPDGAKASGSIRLDMSPLAAATAPPPPPGGVSQLRSVPPLTHERELLGQSESDWCQLRGDHLAMVFQEPMTALNPLHTIGRQVAEPLRLHRGMDGAAARAEALRLLQRVQLPQAARRLDSYPHQLSGGQRQRVVIAIALACRPDLLIADEPTTALDVTIQREVLALIGQLVREDGMALLLISHDLGLMAEHVQRMLVMYGGSVVEAGPTDTVFARLAHPYTRGLFGARPRLGLPRGQRLPTIAGRVPELADLPVGCAFAERCQRVSGECQAALPPTRELSAGHAVRCLHPFEAVQA